MVVIVYVPATGSILFLSPERHFIIIYTGVYVEHYGTYKAEELTALVSGM
jgi:hypothetical protein